MNHSLYLIGRKYTGYVLVELLVSTLLLGTIAALLFSSLANLINGYTSVKTIYQELYSYFRFRKILNDTVAGLDQHRFTLLPRIHSQNIILFTDKLSPNQIMNSASKHAPAVGSNALSAIELDLLNAFDVKTFSYRGQSLEASACPRYGQSFKAEDYRGFIGLNLDKMIEFQGEARLIKAQKPCRLFKLTAAKKSMLLETTGKAVAAPITSIIPIFRQITYYLDKSGELRMLAHQAERNIENQPLFSKIHSIHFSLQPVLDNSLSLLSGKITFPSQRSYSTSVVTRLGRNKHYNFLLNRS